MTAIEAAAAAALARAIGLRPDGAARVRLQRAVTDCAAHDGVAPAEWVAGVEGQPQRMQRLIDQVTVQESAFFRHPEQLEALAGHLRECDARTGSKVIWCAGCAEGEEAWSVAMLLEEQGLADWMVLATDVSQRALSRARAGRYAERRVRALGAYRRTRFLRRDGKAWVIAEPLRERVRFVAHNLVGDPFPPVASATRAILCRNVLIYLEGDVIRTLLDTLARHMAPDGLLFVGGAEAIAPGDAAFEALRRDGVFVYRPWRRQPARAGAPAPADPARARPLPQPAQEDPTPEAPGPHAEEGERLAAAGDDAGAAAAFRRAAYLAPQDPLHHLRLGLALDRLGDPGAARAFRAALAALRAEGERSLEAATGWPADELARLLESKLGPGG